MKKFEYIKTDFNYSDNRGTLVQLVHDGIKQINVLESNKGCIRGKHYHKSCSEYFFIISGSVDVTFSDLNSEDHVVFSKNDFFCIYPNVMHTMYFPENCVMVQMYDIPVEDSLGNKDIYTE
ncbi:WxcM-like domain-containing protein [Succinivibrio dextrinosolvens]|uniref:polysaccharide biosynthesis C-terminal domain-containing protein n=1 Tax=Succinivibrio dextrinosolvens TaxID=83771 RepID=UPI0004E1B3BC|nr:WxcM-like domain-containing protein [Succinivibrio dextrinosolvens]